MLNGLATCGLLLIASQAAALPGLSDGHYAGTGHMLTQLGSTPYTSTLTLGPGTLEATYDYGTSTASYTAVVVARDEHFFDLKDGEGAVIGTGYCLEGKCHLEMTSFHAEETLVEKDGVIARVGSMQHGTATVIYSEDLKRD